MKQFFIQHQQVFDFDLNNQKFVHKNISLNLVHFEQIHIDFDSPDNDIQILNNITNRRKCIEKCLNTSKCVAVAYQLSTGICYLKDCITQLNVKIGTDVVHLAVASNFYSSLKKDISFIQ